MRLVGRSKTTEMQKDKDWVQGLSKRRALGYVIPVLFRAT